MVKCNKNCKKCKQLNVRTDDKGYPYGYDCLKYGDSVFQYEFESTKEFKTEEEFSVWISSSMGGILWLMEID